MKNKLLVLALGTLAAGVTMHHAFGMLSGIKQSNGGSGDIDAKIAEITENSDKFERQLIEGVGDFFSREASLISAFATPLKSNMKKIEADIEAINLTKDPFQAKKLALELTAKLNATLGGMGTLAEGLLKTIELDLALGDILTNKSTRSTLENLIKPSILTLQELGKNSRKFKTALTPLLASLLLEPKVKSTLAKSKSLTESFVEGAGNVTSKVVNTVIDKTLDKAIDAGIRAFEYWLTGKVPVDASEVERQEFARMQKLAQEKADLFNALKIRYDKLTALLNDPAKKLATTLTAALARLQSAGEVEDINEALAKLTASISGGDELTNINNAVKGLNALGEYNIVLIDILQSVLKGLEDFVKALLSSSDESRVVFAAALRGAEDLAKFKMLLEDLPALQAKVIKLDTQYKEEAKKVETKTNVTDFSSMFGSTKKEEPKVQPKTSSLWQ